MKYIDFLWILTISLIALAARFMIDPQWSTATLIAICLMGFGLERWIKFIETRKDMKERTDLEKLSDRISKIELAQGLKHGRT